MPAPRSPRVGPACAALGLAGAFVGVLTGCASYSVSLENASSRAVRVAVEQDQLGGDPIKHAANELAPGGSVRLGPFEVAATDPMSLRVSDAEDAYAVPERIRLEAGDRRYRIEDAAVDSWAKMEVVELPGPGEAGDE